MKTWLARSKNGRTTLISAYTYSDAFQQATAWAGDDLLDDLIEQ
jgi:hypothetical protein